MAIIDLTTAKEHLRVDHNADDADILLKMEEASAIVVDYLKLPVGTWDLRADSGDTSGPDLAPWHVQAAVKLMLGHLYKNREPLEGAKNEVALGYLPTEVTALLHRSRDPALR